jgi:hypothetical protein
MLRPIKASEWHLPKTKKKISNVNEHSAHSRVIIRESTLSTLHRVADVWLVPEFSLIKFWQPMVFFGS